MLALVALALLRGAMVVMVTRDNQPASGSIPNCKTLCETPVTKHPRLRAVREMTGSEQSTLFAMLPTVLVVLCVPSGAGIDAPRCRACGYAVDNGSATNLSCSDRMLIPTLKQPIRVGITTQAYV